MRRCFPLFFLVFLLISITSSGQDARLGASAAQLYEKGMTGLSGVGIGQDDLNAVDYIRRSAELGYPPAQVALGYLYETGTALPKNSTDALEWYKKAGKQGDRVGDWLAGRLYYTGGAARDLNAAELWLQKAASQNDPFGEYLLAMIQLERNDYPKAAASFRKAAMQGLPQAQQKLGELYKQGQGVTADNFESYVWLSLSYEAGNQAVASDLQMLQGDLGNSRVEEAKAKARNLQQTAARAVAARGCTGWSGEFNPIPTPPPPDVQRFCH